MSTERRKQALLHLGKSKEGEGGGLSCCHHNEVTRIAFVVGRFMDRTARVRSDSWFETV